MCLCERMWVRMCPMCPCVQEEVDLEPSEFLKSRLGLSSFGSGSGTRARGHRSATALGMSALRSGTASSADLTEGERAYWAVPSPIRCR